MSGARAMREHPAVALPGRSPLPVLQRSDDDSHCNVDTLSSRLGMLRERIDDIYDGRLELPSPEARSVQQRALHAFAQTVLRFEVPRRHVLDFAEGCAADRALTRYGTWRDLEQHCRRTGGAVALMMSGVLGLTHSDGPSYAVATGSAMRLTSILRNLQPDRDAGRVYLPQEELGRFGYTADELSRGMVNDRFVELMRFQIGRARDLYRYGAEGIRWLAGDGSRIMASLVTVAHAGVLDAIERHRYDVFSGISRTTKARALATLPRAWKLARRRHDQPLPDVFAPSSFGRGLG
jgi:phytoene synthase